MISTLCSREFERIVVMTRFCLNIYPLPYSNSGGTKAYMWSSALMVIIGPQGLSDPLHGSPMSTPQITISSGEVNPLSPTMHELGM